MEHRGQAAERLASENLVEIPLRLTTLPGLLAVIYPNMGGSRERIGSGLG